MRQSVPRTQRGLARNEHTGRREPWRGRRPSAKGDGTMLYNVKGPTNTAKADDEEGLPWWWDGFWALPFTESGEPGTELKLGDTMRIFKSNIEQIYGEPFSSRPDGAPLAER